jgi:DNA/RNA-binding domain of Phe-tRNA-synthetase-like protein
MGLTVAVAAHPLLDVGVFVTRLSRPLADVATSDAIAAFATDPTRDGGAPLVPSETVRAEIRQLLRHGGFKPAGRSKPASEYLHAAAIEGRFPRINAAVDACNVVSLWSGLPISLVDVDRTTGALAVEVLAPGTSFAFNPSGQVIDAGGLLALVDAGGASGTPVKDAQRTKTNDATVAALSIVWGTKSLPGRTARAVAWYRELVATLPDASVEDVALV